MKKILTTAIMLMAAVAAMAQGYVRIDTVLKPYYQFDGMAWIADSNHPVIEPYSIPTLSPYSHFATHYGGDIVQYNYIPGGADIYGIALSTWNAPAGGTMVRPWVYDEYLYLYDAEPDTLF